MKKKKNLVVCRGLLSSLHKSLEFVCVSSEAVIFCFAHSHTYILHYEGIKDPLLLNLNTDILSMKCSLPE